MKAITVTQKIAPRMALSPYDAERFNRLLLDRCGMHFSRGRQAELAMGVKQAFAASTCANLDDYYRLLRDPKAGVLEMDRLINLVTVGETHFFRNQPQFNALYEHVLPELIARQRRARTLRIWSAGCASGEEPYSVAMLLRALLPDVDAWSIMILGTDINNEALARARRAVYGKWAFREARARLWRNRYFIPEGKNYALKPEIRRMVTFARLNLVDDVYPSYETNTISMDLILCRNVTIYFREIVTRRVVNRFYETLVPGGWLVVGYSEPSLSIYHRYETRNFTDTVLYQRVPSNPVDTSTDTPVLALGAADPLATLILPGMNKRGYMAGTAAPRVSPTDDATSEAAEADVDVVAHAAQLLCEGRSEEARDRLLPLSQSPHREATLCALLGQAYANLGEWSDAEYWCRQAIQLDQLATAAYYTLALVYQHQGQLEQAIRTMKTVVYLDRGHVLGHFGLAGLYHESRQSAQAQKSLENARRLLDGMADAILVPNSGGITVGSLRETVRRQQQRWADPPAVPGNQPSRGSNTRANV